jgi:hypothetical protein
VWLLLASAVGTPFLGTLACTLLSADSGKCKVKSGGQETNHTTCTSRWPWKLERVASVACYMACLVILVGSVSLVVSRFGAPTLGGLTQGCDLPRPGPLVGRRPEPVKRAPGRPGPLRGLRLVREGTPGAHKAPRRHKCNRAEVLPNLTPKAVGPNPCAAAGPSSTRRGGQRFSEKKGTFLST